MEVRVKGRTDYRKPQFNEYIGKVNKDKKKKNIKVECDFVYDYNGSPVEWGSGF